jgi:Fur family peroxide stress response transcriptional regulator
MNYSRQREAILQAVEQSTLHPTAEEIYACLKDKWPRLRLATVYRDLNQLYGADMLKRLRLPNSPDRFDAIKHPHYHLYCEKCQAVIDLDFPSVNWESIFGAELCAHEIKDCEIIFYGTCASCMEK